MDFSGHINFEGRGNVPRWILKREETGLIEVLLDTDGGDEMVLNFEPQLLRSLMENVQDFFNGKTVKNLRCGQCRVTPELSLFIEDEDISLKVDWDQPNDDNPLIEISEKRWGRVSLGLNVNQARVLAECCRKIIEIKSSLADLQKSKFVSAKSEPA